MSVRSRISRTLMGPAPWTHGVGDQFAEDQLRGVDEVLQPPLRELRGDGGAYVAYGGGVGLDVPLGDLTCRQHLRTGDEQRDVVALHLREQGVEHGVAGLLGRLVGVCQGLAEQP